MKHDEGNLIFVKIDVWYQNISCDENILTFSKMCITFWMKGLGYIINKKCEIYVGL